MKFRLGAALAAMAALLAACKSAPRDGEMCAPEDKDRRVCEGAGAVLACQQFRWHRYPCRGPKGCSGADGAVCDDTVAQAGDPCIMADHPLPGLEHACTADGKQAVACEDGQWVAGRTCRGAKGCSLAASAECDQSVAEVGDGCNAGESAFGACSGDGKAVLRCERLADASKRHGRVDGSFVLDRECPSKDGCKVGHAMSNERLPAPVCQFRDAQAGDACGRGNEGREVCSGDQRSVLRCDGATSKLVVGEACPPSTKCQPFQGNASVVTCRP